MQSIILPESLHELDISDPLIAMREATPRSDTLNSVLAQRMEGANAMVSGVFAFPDRPAIRYRRTFRNSHRADEVWYNQVQADFVNDDVFNELLIQWIRKGKGEAVMCISQRMNPNLYEMYPHKEGEDYFFYNGRYGTSELWNTVRQARVNRNSIPKAVYDAYAEHFYTDPSSGKTRHDNYAFRETVNYDHPDEGIEPRIYRAFIWKDGEITHDDHFTNGFAGGMRTSNIEHRRVHYAVTESDSGAETLSWGCY